MQFLNVLLNQVQLNYFISFSKEQTKLHWQPTGGNHWCQAEIPKMLW